MGTDATVSLVVVGAFLVLLFVSTCAWALSQARRIAEEEPAGGLMKARLWGAIVGLVLLTVVMVAAAMALFNHGGATGQARIVEALASRVVIAGLVVSAATALYPAYLCAGVWRSRSGSIAERLHLSLHIAAVCSAILILLGLRNLQG